MILVKSSLNIIYGLNMQIKKGIKTMNNKFYLHEFQIWDGEATITFNIVNLNELKNEIEVAITNRGRISVVTYPLFQDENGYYFEYGCEYTKINVNDFKEVID